MLQNMSSPGLSEAINNATRNAVTSIDQKQNPLEGHDVALYVDGKRISVLSQSVLYPVVDENGDLSVLFQTTLESALNPDVNAQLSAAWDGFKPDQTVNVQAPGQPMGGVFQIKSVRPPTLAGQDATFVGIALTPIYDWVQDGALLAKGGDECEISAAWIQKQS